LTRPNDGVLFSHYSQRAYSASTVTRRQECRKTSV
jgi:hypothetical protein